MSLIQREYHQYPFWDLALKIWAFLNVEFLILTLILLVTEWEKYTKLHLILTL